MSLGKYAKTIYLEVKLGDSIIWLLILLKVRLFKVEGLHNGIISCQIVCANGRKVLL